MAFLISNFSRMPTAFNTGRVTLNGPAYANGPAMFTYVSTTDAVATVGAANYFNGNASNPGVLYDLNVNDIIVCVCSDASIIYQVTAVDAEAGTNTVASFTAAGSVGTANIVDLAVTTAKIDDLAVTAGKIAADAVTTAKILNANVTLAKLAAGITPSHVVKYAGQPTTVGGAAAEAFTVTGVAATDLAFVQIVNNGTNNVTVLQAVCTLNTLTITFSGDPAADTVFNYQILRAAA